MAFENTDPILRVETRFKNARLYNAIVERSVQLGRTRQAATLHRMGPIKAFCDLHGLCLEVVYRLLNMRAAPVDPRGRVRPTCGRLAAILEQSVEDLFPAALYAIEWPMCVVKEMDEVALARLMPTTSNIALPPTQEQDIVNEELRAALARAIGTLTKREQTVVTMKYGLDGAEHDLDEIERAVHVGRARLWQIEQTALRKLRNPRRCKPLRPFMERRGD